MMKRAIVAAVGAFCAFASSAVNVQVGFSALDRMGDNRLAPEWHWATNSIGGTGPGHHIGLDYGFEDGSFGCGLNWRRDNGDRNLGGVGLTWSDASNPARVTLTEAASGSAGMYSFTVEECHRCPSFGWVMAPYLDRRVEYGVFTIRGDPYSLVVNDTSEDRVVNGVTIPAGQGRRLLFPFHLQMDEIDGARFYDLESGDEFWCYDYAYYGESGMYYRNGHYTPAWTGDFRFTDGSRAEREPPLEPLVFGDMVSENADKPLFAQNEMPIYADGKEMATNIQLMTWWDFNQDAWGSSPLAYINDDCVCGGHSTSHIIAYTVSTAGAKVYGNGNGVVDFTMWQTPQSGSSGGSCTMRCWDASAGSGTSGYATAAPKRRAEASAGLGVARFRLRFNVYTGEWSVFAR